MEGHRSCVWGEGRLGPGGSQKGTAKTLDFPWRAASRADVGGNLAAILDETIDLFACTFRSSTSQDISVALKEVISLDLSSRTIRRYLKNMLGNFQHCKITERQGEWNPLKWTRLASNWEWTWVWIVHGCILHIFRPELRVVFECHRNTENSQSSSLHLHQ